MLPNAFRGHGTFFYLAEDILHAFSNDAARVVAAVKQAGMQHVWVRLHDHRLRREPEAPTRKLVRALTEGGVSVAGWGFVRGEDPENDAIEAAKCMTLHGLDHYVANIENEKHNSRWTTEAIPRFFERLRGELPSGAAIAVSSYPFITWHEPELMAAAAPHVDLFAPQVYWHDYPNARMLSPGELPRNPSRTYTVESDLHDPAAYTDLCLDHWRDLVGSKPIVVTGQAYWEGGFSRENAERKLARFFDRFEGWQRIVGANWWDFARRRNTEASGAMTQAMFSAIAAEPWADRPFKVA